MLPIVLLTVFLFTTLSPDLRAQTDYLKQTVGVGVGAGLPQGGFAQYYTFTNRPGILAEYSYRFHRNFQTDVALDAVIGGNHLADNSASRYQLKTNLTSQLFLPFGGRAILPLQRGRILLSVGGGPAYLHYTSPGAGEYSYSGWGWYGLGAANVALDKAQRFRIGVVGRNYRAKTTGPYGLTIGNGKDRWVNVHGELTFSFGH